MMAKIKVRNPLACSPLLRKGGVHGVYKKLPTRKKTCPQEATQTWQEYKQDLRCLNR